MTITESDPQTGQCHQHDLLIQKEQDVSDREPWEMRTYIFKQAKWVKEISLQVQKNYEESDRCEIGQFKILVQQFKSGNVHQEGL